MVGNGGVFWIVSVATASPTRAATRKGPSREGLQRGAPSAYRHWRPVALCQGPDLDMDLGQVSDPILIEQLESQLRALLELGSPALVIAPRAIAESATFLCQGPRVEDRLTHAGSAGLT